MLKNSLLILSLFATLLFSTTTLAATEIVWWHAMGGELEKEVNEIAKAFNLSQKDFVIKPVLKGNYEAIVRDAEQAFASGDDLPALIQLSEATTVTAIYKYKDYLYFLDDLMQDYKTDFDASVFIAPVASYYESLDGKLYSFPFNASTPVLWYNKDLFLKAGVKKLPTTWQDMVEVGEQLQANGVECGFTVSYPSWILLENFSAWHNLEFATNKNGYAGLNTKLKFNNQSMKNFFELLADLSAKGVYNLTSGYDNLLKQFVNQECAMWIGSSSSLNDIYEKAKFRFGETSMPYDTRIVKAPQNSIIGGASLWAVKGQSSSVYKGLIKFIQYLSRDDLQTIWHTETGYVPVTTGARMQASNIRLNIVRYGSDTALKQLSLNPPTQNSKGIRIGNLLEIRQIAEAQIKQAMQGKKTASAALDEAVRQGNAKLEEFARQNGR